MVEPNKTKRYDVVIVGAGQAGLSVGYYLLGQGLTFIILDAHKRVGDAWRTRWDSLRLFTPARYCGLAGMPFPAPGFAYPTKDEMANYLESYAVHFNLPLRNGTRVDSLTKEGDRFILTAGDSRFEAKNVVVALSNYQEPRLPSFAAALDPKIVQLHSSDYRNASQLQKGNVLVVGAGNSGADISSEVAHTHHTWLAGRDTGHVPFRIEGIAARMLVPFLFRIVFHRVLTVNTPIGRKMRGKVLSGGGWPLVRVKPRDLAAAGVERVPKVVGVRDGLPSLEDGRMVDVTNIIWCTGYQSAFSWIKLPIFDNDKPMHQRGLVANEPGLYFVGLDFLYAASSSMIHGVGRDAAYVAKHVASRAHVERTNPERQMSVPTV